MKSAKGDELSDKMSKDAGAAATARLDHEPPTAIAAEGWRYHHTS
jgi:hypothetical protein